jgi:TonB family protein
MKLNSRQTLALGVALLSPLAGWAQFGADELRTANASLQIIQTVAVRFPPELKQRGVDRGEARVMILVDTDGQLLDSLVTAYTHARFAKEALETLHQWRFVPARRRGQPVPARTEVRFVFRLEGQVVSVHGPEVLARDLQSKRQPDDELTRVVVEPDQLDDGLRLQNDVAPDWPPGEARRREARVTLDFFVDPHGRPRLAAVVQSDGEAFSRAAMQALMRSRYVDPQRAREPVAVRATREYVFRPTAK